MVVSGIMYATLEVYLLLTNFLTIRGLQKFVTTNTNILIPSKFNSFPISITLDVTENYNGKDL